MDTASSTMQQRVVARLSGVWHHARAHRFFSLASWQPDELGLRIAELIAQRLCETVRCPVWEIWPTSSARKL